jgi:GntR family transcriptional regulator
MVEEFQVSKPIYMQIVDKIMIDIIQGKQGSGEKLPSVREMAVQMGVNPNTIQRTYSELERIGIVESRRGQGTFVAGNHQMQDELAGKMQTEVIDAFISKMKELGVGKNELVSLLKKYLEEGK